MNEKQLRYNVDYSTQKPVFKLSPFLINLLRKQRKKNIQDSKKKELGGSNKEDKRKKTKKMSFQSRDQIHKR